jgi:Ca2+-binding EF-hand superfamily protein
MRTLYKVPLTLALIAIPVVALANPGKDHKGRIAKFDTNGDGTLDATEREAMAAAHKDRKTARHAEMLAKFDIDKDGTLDDSERAAKKQAMADLAFDRLDVNKDGSISRSEFAAGMRDFGGRGRGGHGGRGK